MPFLSKPLKKKKPGSKSFIGPVKPKAKPKAKARRKSKLRTAIEKGISRRRLKRLAKKGKVSSANINPKRKNQPVKASTYSRKGMKAQEKAVPGMSRTGKVSRGAVGAVKTKGGTYVKYKKDSKAAGSFRSKFKAACGGGAKSFKWQGRSYSCKKA